MSEHRVKVQDGFLNFLRRERVPVAVHFFTGMQLRGTVRGFDTYTIVLELEGTNKQVLIFKHGILFVDPIHPVGDILERITEETRQVQQASKPRRRRRVTPEKEPATTP